MNYTLPRLKIAPRVMHIPIRILFFRLYNNNPIFMNFF